MTRTYAKAWLAHLPSWQGTAYPVNRNHEGQRAFVRDMQKIEEMLSTIPGYPAGEIIRVVTGVEPLFNCYSRDMESVRRAIVTDIKPVIAEWLAKYIDQEQP